MPARNLTLSIDQALSDTMEKFPEVNWSEIARKAISQYLEARTRTTIPAEVVAKLRAEKGEESVRGREFALKDLLSTLKYPELEKLMIGIQEKTQQVAEVWAKDEEFGMEEVDWAGARVEAATQLLKSRMPFGFSLEFVRGVLATLDDAYNLLAHDK